LEREEFIDEYIDELYGPGRMDYIRKGLKDGLKELGYQVVLEVGTHYGSAGAGWIGGRILSWTSKRFKSMWSAWRGSRVVGKALQEETEAATEQMPRSSKGVPGPTPLRGAPTVTQAAFDAAQEAWSVLPQLKMEFVSGRLGNSLTGDSTHEFQPPSLHT
jgi:hypothetical protein